MINFEICNKLISLHVQFKSVTFTEILTIAKVYKVNRTEATFHLSITDVGFLCAEPLAHFTLYLIRRTVTIGAILTSYTSVIGITTRNNESDNSCKFDKIIYFAVNK